MRSAWDKAAETAAIASMARDIISLRANTTEVQKHNFSHGPEGLDEDGQEEMRGEGDCRWILFRTGDECLLAG